MHFPRHCIIARIHILLSMQAGSTVRRCRPSRQFPAKKQLALKDQHIIVQDQFCRSSTLQMVLQHGAKCSAPSQAGAGNRLTVPAMGCSRQTSMH